MLALYSVMSALIDLSIDKESQLNVVNRRIETEEKSKTSKSKKNLKLSQFLSDQKELNSHIAILERHISMIFEQYFFVNRHDFLTSSLESSYLASEMFIVQFEMLPLKILGIGWNLFLTLFT
jgi:hypothetical protein